MATADWASNLRAALRALLSAMLPHPEIAHLVTDRLLEHPDGLALTEIALLSLSAAGFESEPASYRPCRRTSIDVFIAGTEGLRRRQHTLV